MSCVTCTIVTRPCSRPVWMRSSRSWSSARVSASTEANGSSSSSTCGSRDERPRDRDALLHPAGELPGIRPRDSFQADLGERGFGARSALGPGQPMSAERERDVSHDVEPREERAAVVLEDDGELARRPQDRAALVRTSPALAALRPQRSRSSVVLPQPDGPTIASSSPASTSNVTSLSAGRPVVRVALRRGPRRAAIGSARGSAASGGCTVSASRVTDEPLVPGEHATLGRRGTDG